MKKSSTFILALALLASCAGNSNKETTDSTQPTQDSVTEAADAVTAQEEPAAYLSSDLKQFNLHGQVKRVTDVQTSGSNDDAPGLMVFTDTELLFNKEGKLTSTFENWIYPKFTLNDEGFIKTTYSRESDGLEYNLKFTEWDENNNPTAGTYESEGGGYEESYKLTFTYPEYDNYGNWTVRLIKYNGKHGEYPDMADEMVYKNGNGTMTQSRKITYWE